MKLKTSLVLALALACGASAQFYNGFLLEGKNGWFFVVDEFRYFKQERAETIYDATDLIGMVSKLFKERGVQLYPTVVPIRARIYADQLPAGLELPPQIVNRYQTLLIELRKAGAKPVDLNALFSAEAKRGGPFPLYLKNDHHWSSVGSVLAGKEVARQIAADNDLSGFDAVESTLVRREPRLSPKGPLAADGKTPGPPTEQYLPVYVEQAASSALLDDETFPIALVGDSFSRGEEADLGLFPYGSVIEHFTQRRVLNAALSGQGPWIPLANYVRGDAYRKGVPRALVWELWETFLTDAGQGYIPDHFLTEVAPNILGRCALPVATLPKTGAVGASLAQKPGSKYLSFTARGMQGSAQMVFRYKGSEVKVPLPASSGTFNVMIPRRNAPLERVALLDTAGREIPLENAVVCAMPAYYDDFVALNGKAINYSKRDHRNLLDVTGFYISNDNLNERWALTGRSDIRFLSKTAAEGQVEANGYTLFPNEEITVLLNGQTLTTVKADAGNAFGFKVGLRAVAGENTLTFVYSQWRGSSAENQKRVNPADPRPLAVNFQNLGLSLR